MAPPHVEILERSEIIPAIIKYRIDIRGQYLSGIQNDQIMPTSDSMFARDNNRLSDRHCLPVSFWHNFLMSNWSSFQVSLEHFLILYRTNTISQCRFDTFIWLQTDKISRIILMSLYYDVKLTRLFRYQSNTFLILIFFIILRELR